jgi:hypothetical protein
MKTLHHDNNGHDSIIQLLYNGNMYVCVRVHGRMSCEEEDTCMCVYEYMGACTSGYAISIHPSRAEC